jgi:hypothetical protein
MMKRIQTSGCAFFMTVQMSHTPEFTIFEASLPLLDEAILVAQRRGKARVRLDCWDGNEFLKRYYRARGFHDLGRAQEADYWVRLFERMAFRA